MPMRPARCYTHFTSPPYTRREYIHGIPQPKITKFEMGSYEVMARGDVKAELVAIEGGQVRHNALEAARVAINKYLSRSLGDQGFYFRVRVYPHHVIRENKMMAFAGADRLQDGMRQAFGKPIGTAARVAPGTVILEAWGFRGSEEKLKEALRRGSRKIPVRTRIEVKYLKGSSA